MIRIENLSVAFDGPEVVKNVSLTIEDGEILGVVGESGSGKSVTALTVMGLLAENARVTGGKIFYDDTLLLEAGKPRDNALLREYRGDRMSMVFQEPMTSLNPTKKVGAQVEEMLTLHVKEMSGPERRERVLNTLRSVGLADAERVYDCYPHQLSGGMRQRAVIAMAVILRPGLIIADEPTTALDVSVQNQIVELLGKINREQKNSMLFITHDLNLARRICGRIAVMQDGRLVESGEAEDIFEHPREEYTKKLIAAVPGRNRRKKSDAPKKEQRSEVGKDLLEAESEKRGRTVLTEVRDLSVFYREKSNSLLSRSRKKCVVEHADFSIYQGEILGLVGESGCGKTSLSKAILGINRMTQGSVTHHSNAPQMVFQDPYSSLNPAKDVGWLLQEPLRAQGILDPAKEMSPADREAAAYEMLRKVGLEEQYFHRRPSQLSGGQRQRISIAQALITKPGLVIADEPVSALDVTIQAQVLELIRSLQEELGTAFLFISHDINVIYQVSDRIMVMREGKILEIGETEELFRNPKNEYTEELLR